MRQSILVTVDSVLFGLRDHELSVLLIERGNAPFKGAWAIPGGIVDQGESLEDAVRRELKEETDLSIDYLEQFYTFGDPKRDPRGHVISIAYYALVPFNKTKVTAGSDAEKAAWFPVSKLPLLAFDHKEIIETGLRAVQAKIDSAPIAEHLLPETFTLTQLQTVYEAIKQAPIDKRNFRKAIMASGLVKKAKGVTTEFSRRPAQLFRF